MAQTVLVTGSTSGFGRLMVETLALMSGMVLSTSEKLDDSPATSHSKNFSTRACEFGWLAASPIHGDWHQHLQPIPKHAVPRPALPVS